MADQPIAQYSAIIALAIVFQFLTLRKKRFQLLFTSSFFLSTFLLVFSSRIYPAIPQVSHYLVHCVEPLFYIVFIISLYDLIHTATRNRAKLSNIAITIVLVIVLFTGAYRQYRYSEKYSRAFTLKPGLSNVLTWMDKNLPKDSVALSYNSELTELLPVYTGLNLFAPIIIFATSDEIDERFMASLAVAGCDASSLATISESVWKYYYQAGYEARREQIQFDFISKYSKTDKSKLIEIIRYKYRADYVVLAPQESELEKGIKQNLNMEEIYSKDLYKVYKIIGVSSE